MDWSGLDTGFLEGDRLPSENLKLTTADSFFSLSSREPLLGEEHLGKPLLGEHHGKPLLEEHLGKHLLGEEHLGKPLLDEHLGQTWQGSQFNQPSPLPLPHSAASYRSTLLLKSCSSTLDICHHTSDSLEPDEANLETGYVDFEADEANPAADEVNFEEEEDVDLDISLYLASSSPRKNSIEESVQIFDDLGTDQALGVSEFSDEIAVTSDIGANNSTLEMSVQLFEEDIACTGLPNMPEQFLSIQEQLGIVQEKLMSSHLPF